MRVVRVLVIPHSVHSVIADWGVLPRARIREGLRFLSEVSIPRQGTRAMERSVIVVCRHQSADLRHRSATLDADRAAVFGAVIGAVAAAVAATVAAAVAAAVAAVAAAAAPAVRPAVPAADLRLLVQEGDFLSHSRLLCDGRRPVRRLPLRRRDEPRLLPEREPATAPRKGNVAAVVAAAPVAAVIRLLP